MMNERQEAFSSSFILPPSSLLFILFELKRGEPRNQRGSPAISVDALVFELLGCGGSGCILCVGVCNRLVVMFCRVEAQDFLAQTRARVNRAQVLASLHLPDGRHLS